MDGRCSIPDVGRDSSGRLVVGPWDVLLIVSAWTVSYFSLYFQATLFLSNLASELVTEVCLSSVSLGQFRNFRRLPDMQIAPFCLHALFRSSAVSTVFLALSSRK